MARYVVLILALVVAGTSFSEEVNVTRKDREFQVSMSMLVDAESILAQRVLSEFGKYAALHHAILKSEVVYDAPSYIPRLSTKIKGCVWFFCKRLKWAGDISQVSPGHWRAITVDDQTSFEAGQTEWGLRVNGDEQSEFFFDATFKVGFWVPPGIGEWLIKRKLHKEIKELVTNIAAQANKGKDDK